MINKFKKEFTLSSSKGFTLIELLVVIAIIGILAAIIIANLGGARNVAKDGAVKSEMANMRAQAELYAQQNGNAYTLSTATPVPSVACDAGDTMFDPSAPNSVGSLIAGVTGNGVTPVCGATSSAWATLSPLPSDPTNLFWCVDSSGNSTASSSAVVAATTKCL